MSSEQYNPEVGDPDFWIDPQYDGDAEIIESDEASEGYDDLEDLIYGEFHDATQQGSAEYTLEEAQELFEYADEWTPSELADRPSEAPGVALVDSNGKAAYGMIQQNGDTVELDIKVFGDATGVARHIEDVPVEGDVRGGKSAMVQAYRNAAARTDKHPMNVETETQLDEPGETTESGFTNSQAERIKNKVLEGEAI